MFGVTLEKYGSPEEALKYSSDIPIPKCGEYDVTVEVAYSGFNHLDTKIRRGYMKHMQIKILGIEYSGIVKEVGENQKKYKVADRVFGFSMPQMSTYSQYLRIPGGKGIVMIPEGISLKEASLYPCSIYTVWQSFKKMFEGTYDINDSSLYEGGKHLTLMKGKSIAILGCSGPLGVTSVLMAKYLFGCEKIYGICSKKNHEKMKEIGCDVMIDYTVQEYEQQLFQDPNLTYVLDCFGGYANMEKFAPGIQKKEDCMYLTPGVPDGVNPGEFIGKIKQYQRMHFVGHQKNDNELLLVTKLFKRFGCVGKTPIAEYPIEKTIECHETFHSSQKPMGKMIIKVKK